MVDGGEVFGVVIGPVVGAWCPKKRNWTCASRQRNQCRRIFMNLSLFGTMVLLTTPPAVELSVWMEDFP